MGTLRMRTDSFSSSSSSSSSTFRGLKQVASYDSPQSGTTHVSLVISQGSVVDFEHPNGCIVNAANEGCLGGGGVDGAITEAGGPDLARDRLLLPSSIPNDDSYYKMIRCPTGDARRTGPAKYGTLKVPHVIHAVGPRYFDYEDRNEVPQADQLLQSAYRNTLERAKEVHLQAVAFSLLSAGVYRGSQTRYHVLRIGMETILQFEGYEALQEVHMCAFSPVECRTLMNIAQDLGLRKNNNE